MAEGGFPSVSLLEARAPEYEALQDAFEGLHDTICPEGIAATLYSRNLLSKIEAETIRSKATRYEKCEDLLFAISRRSPSQVVQFCQFLLEKQSHCGHILKEGNFYHNISHVDWLLQVPAHKSHCTKPCCFLPVLNTLLS